MTPFSPCIAAKTASGSPRRQVTTCMYAWLRVRSTSLASFRWIQRGIPLTKETFKADAPEFGQMPLRSRSGSQIYLTDIRQWPIFHESYMEWIGDHRSVRRSRRLQTSLRGRGRGSKRPCRRTIPGKVSIRSAPSRLLRGCITRAVGAVPT